MSNTNTLTPDVLRHLYEVEGLTDTEIAKRYGTYQVSVNRLRQKWGIATRLKSDRLNLPDKLSSRLRSILIGSMLGDGGLRKTGDHTAGYVEHHSESQRAYLDWKAAEWGPFTSSIITSDKGEYRGFRLLTHGSRTLFPYWTMFYPAGEGDKVFTRLSASDVDALGLAVWFMDDGSKSGSYVRFSVGPNEANQRAQLRILRGFDLKPKLYESDGDVAIHLTDQTSMTRFVDLVRPHMHPSMSYKLDVTSRSAGPAARDVLTDDALRPLVERGLRASTIAQILNVSRTSTARALRRMGLAAPTGRPASVARVELTLHESERLIQGLDTQSESYLDDVVRALLRTEVPIVPAAEAVALKDIEHLRKSRTTIDASNVFQQVGRAGAQVCGRHFVYRWDARYRENLSPRAAWYDEKTVRRAVGFQIRVGDPVVPKRVFRAVQAVVRSPTNFRPTIAKAVVERYCPEGGIVLDPCAGYGGRAAGTLAAGRTYVGVDPHPNAPAAYEGLARDFGPTSRLTFHNAPYEDIDLGGLAADTVFTSPPYFAVERYSDASTQSWVRYKSWEAWVEGFLRPFVLKSWKHLREGGAFCVNTKDIRDGRRIYPIATELVRIATEAGFQLVETLQMPIGRIGKEARSEPLMVFQKGESIV